MIYKLNTEVNTFLRVKIPLLLLITIIYLICANGTPWVEADDQLQIARNLIQHRSLSTARKDYEI